MPHSAGFIAFFFFPFFLFFLVRLLGNGSLNLDVYGPRLMIYKGFLKSPLLFFPLEQQLSSIRAQIHFKSYHTTTRRNSKKNIIGLEFLKIFFRVLLQWQDPLMFIPPLTLCLWVMIPFKGGDKKKSIEIAFRSKSNLRIFISPVGNPSFSRQAHLSK